MLIVTVTFSTTNSAAALQLSYPLSIYSTRPGKLAAAYASIALSTRAEQRSTLIGRSRSGGDYSVLKKSLREAFDAKDTTAPQFLRSIETRRESDGG